MTILAINFLSDCYIYYEKSEGYSMTKNIIKRRLPILLMALVFVSSLTTSVVKASDISGITGNNGVFNIDPAGAISRNGESIGYRNYDNFNLTNGDTANLKFDSGISTFVNMVQNQINIDGTLNTMKNGALNNGNAVFVSPKGLVVGSSGVLNVGSLSVYTPTAPGMKMLQDGFAAGSLTTTYKGQQIDLLDAMSWHGNAPVTINGTIHSAGDINMVANQFTQGSSSSITAGDELFGALVNTGNINIRSYDRQNNGKLEINGKITNNANGDILIQNRGSQGLSVGTNAEIETKNGKLYLVNSTGTANISGKITGNGDKVYLTSGKSAGTFNFNGTLNSNAGAEIYTRSSAGANIDGTITNKGHGMAITNESGVLKLNGNIKNENSELIITNKGSKLLLDTNGKIDSSGKLQISSNGADGMQLNGEIKNSKNTAITNHKGNLSVNGTVQNTAGKMNITNKGNGGLELSAGSNIYGAGDEVLIQNAGSGGFSAEGNIESSAPTYLQNTDGEMNISGNISNDGGLLYIGNIKDGSGALNISKDATISNKNAAIQIVNLHSEGMNIDGTVKNNNGGIAVANRAGNMNIAGNINNEKGNINLTNTGDGALNVKAKGTVGSEKGELVIQNSGNDGINIDGTITNKGYTIVYNKAGDLNIDGDVTVYGARLNVSNRGEGQLHIKENAEIINEGMGRTYITNYGSGGMDIEAPVVGGGHVILTNRKGGMNVSSTVTSANANVVLTNTGEKNMVIDGTVRGDKVTAYAKGNDIVLGNKDTNQIAINGLKKVYITADDGSILNAGVDTNLIKSGGNLYMATTNGSIGEDVAGSDGIGEDARDLTKSINVAVNGKVKAFTTDKNKNSVINIATKGHDLRVDRIKADGKVLLLTDKYTDENGIEHTGSILNAGTELDKYANVKGTSISLISSGSIGTAEKPLHFRQTDASKPSNVLATKDVYMHARGEDNEVVYFDTIKSKEGSLNVNIIGEGTVNNAIAPGAINISARKNGANLKVNNISKNPGVIKDYIDSSSNTSHKNNNQNNNNNESLTTLDEYADWMADREDIDDVDSLEAWVESMPDTDEETVNNWLGTLSDLEQDEIELILAWLEIKPDSSDLEAYESWLETSPLLNVDIASEDSNPS